MSSLFVPTQCSALRVGGYMLINNRPSKIVSMKTSKTGKHGGAKVHFFAIDIFTDKKYEYLEMSTANIDVPYVTRYDFQVLDIDDGTISYLDDKGNTFNDLYVPNLSESDKELAENLQKTFDEGNEVYITVLSSMDISAVKGFRVKTV